MRLVAVVTIIAVPVFVLLAMWNSAVAMLFAIAALTFLLSTLYFRFSSADPFEGALTTRGEKRRNRD